MIKRLLAIAVLGVTVSGCFMAPLALVGPATSGFSTASLIQSGVTTSANYMVKQSTGKTIGEHAIDAINENNQQTLKQKHDYCFFGGQGYIPILKGNLIKKNFL